MSRDDWPGNERFGPVTIFRPNPFAQLASDKKSPLGPIPNRFPAVPPGGRFGIGPFFSLTGILLGTKPTTFWDFYPIWANFLCTIMRQFVSDH